jgi:hypothetical protein
MFVLGPCFVCKQRFSFNADHVPSIPGEVSGTGTREPICRSCVERVNPMREANGLPPIVPHPDAYEAQEVT